MILMQTDKAITRMLVTLVLAAGFATHESSAQTRRGKARVTYAKKRAPRRSASYKLAKLAWNDASSRKPAAALFTDFGKYVDKFNKLRSMEFAGEFSYNMSEYNEKLRKSGKDKVRLLKDWGIKNLGLYCAELTDKILDETIRNLGFSEYRDVVSSSNRNFCPTVAEDMYRKCKEHDVSGGYTSAIKTKIREMQKSHPYDCYLAVVDSKGNVSGSGLHQVMIAPALDDNGDFIMTEITVEGKNGKATTQKVPKMAVYSFNNESVQDLDSYNKAGAIYNISGFARKNVMRKVENDGFSDKEMRDIKTYVDENSGLLQKEERSGNASSAHNVSYMHSGWIYSPRGGRGA